MLTPVSTDLRWDGIEVIYLRGPITPGRKEVEAHIIRLRDGEEDTMRDRHGEASQDAQLAPRPPSM